MDGKQTDQVLAQMYAAQGQPQGQLAMTKEAEAQINAEVSDAFLSTMFASGWDQPGLEKYASENPQGYAELFNSWLVNTATAIQQAEAQAAMVKQAEAEKMEKLAEDIFAGRVMAHAFVDEISNIFHEMQKMGESAEAEAKREGESVAQEKKEKEKEKDEKKEEKKEEGKTASALPKNVAEFRDQLMKQASARPITPQEIRFLSLCEAAEAGYPVKWQ